MSHLEQSCECNKDLIDLKFSSSVESTCWLNLQSVNFAIDVKLVERHSKNQNLNCQQNTFQMKRVAIISGLTKSTRYNAHLAEKYKGIGLTSNSEHQFNRGVLFCCHMHHLLDKEIGKIVEENDVIHCQSGSFFRVLTYFEKNNIKKPLILESPVLRANTGTLFSSLGWSKSYLNVKENALIKTILDTVCFTPAWTETTLNTLSKLGKNKQILVLHGKEDTVSDITGLEKHFHHIFLNGHHARLFHKDMNDFGLIEDYIKNNTKQGFGEKKNK